MEKFFHTDSFRYGLAVGKILAKKLSAKLPVIERYEDGEEYNFTHWQATPLYLRKWNGDECLQHIDLPQSPFDLRKSELFGKIRPALINNLYTE